MKALKIAAEKHDREAVIALFDKDIIVRSPITRRIMFKGIDQVRELFECVFEVIHDIQFYETIGEGQISQVIFWKGRVNGLYLEEANLLRLNDNGLIKEMTVFMRPLPGLLALAAELASALARRRSKSKAIFIKYPLLLYGFFYRLFEPLFVNLTSAGSPMDVGKE